MMRVHYFNDLRIGWRLLAPMLLKVNHMDRGSIEFRDVNWHLLLTKKKKSGICLRLQQHGRVTCNTEIEGMFWFLDDVDCFKELFITSIKQYRSKMFEVMFN